MKIIVNIKHLASGEVFPEKYEIPNDRDPEKWARDLVAQFNASLYPNESPREFISVSIIDDASPLPRTHGKNKTLSP